MNRVCCSALRWRLSLGLVCLLGALSAFAAEKTLRQAQGMPNVIYILADDLGYGEVGYNGQEKIKTPELDAMAKAGMTFTAHYAGNAVCASSRCSLMTGMHPGNAYIRANSKLYPNSQTPLPEDTETVAKLMQRAGYETALIGKWGLGGVLENVDNPVLSSGHPSKQGFDYFFGYLDQRRAHRYYPDFLWRNTERVMLNNKANGSDSDDDYSHDLMTEEAVSLITENKDKPMFLYLAYCIPHTEWRVPELGDYADKDWPEEHFKIQAAMVSRMDRDIGRIKRLLEELGIADNTLIMFNSDNGAHAQGGTREFFATTGGLKKSKRYVYEGGIRSPMFAYWPGKVPAGTTSDHMSAFWDLLPTMAEFTGEPVKGSTDGISMLPTLLGEPEKQKQHDYLYWENYAGRASAALRMGNWKGVIPDFRRPEKLELYNLENDELETQDVADQYPEVMTQIRNMMAQAHTPSPLYDVTFDKYYNVEEACRINGVEPIDREAEKLKKQAEKKKRQLEAKKRKQSAK